MSPSNSVQGAITPDTCIEKLLQVFHVSLPQKRSRAGVSVTDQQRVCAAFTCHITCLLNYYIEPIYIEYLHLENVQFRDIYFVFIVI